MVEVEAEKGGIVDVEEVVIETGCSKMMKDMEIVVKIEIEINGEVEVEVKKESM